MNNKKTRLKTIIKLINEGECVADVGSDHGIVPITLLEDNIAKRAFANENKIGPFRKLEKNVNESKVDKSRLEISLSDGLEKLPKYIDTVVIAGMGGELISSILENGRNKISNVKKFIIDAHSDYPVVIEKLRELGYIMTDDIYVKENGIYYMIAQFEKTDSEIKYNELEAKFGPVEVKRKSDGFVNHLQKELERFNYILSLNINNEKRDYILEEIRLINEVLKEEGTN